MKEYVKPYGEYLLLCVDESFAVGSCTGSCHDWGSTVIKNVGPTAERACS